MVTNTHLVRVLADFVDSRVWTWLCELKAQPVHWIGCKRKILVDLELVIPCVFNAINSHSECCLDLLARYVCGGENLKYERWLRVRVIPNIATIIFNAIVCAFFGS